MFDYGDILGTLEEIVESIDFDETSLQEIKAKLQLLISEIEENDFTGNSYDDFDFDDLE